MTRSLLSRFKPVLCAIILGACSSALVAAEITFSCDVAQGFNFRTDSQSSFGYITALTVGTTPLRADFTVKSPIDSSSITAVAILSQVNWNAGASDPISFTGQVSSANKQTINLLLHQSPFNTQAQIGFVVFTYDPMAKKYYKSFFPVNGATLSTAIAKSGTAPQLIIGSNPGSVASPVNYQMSVTMAPPSSSQKVQFATGSSNQVIKSWGVGTP